MRVDDRERIAGRKAWRFSTRDDILRTGLPRASSRRLRKHLAEDVKARQPGGAGIEQITIGKSDAISAGYITAFAGVCFMHGGKVDLREMPVPA